jgi:hypothetical protein
MYLPYGVPPVAQVEVWFGGGTYDVKMYMNVGLTRKCFFSF